MGARLSLTGRVTDAGTGSPLGGLAIEAVNAAGSTVAGAATDAVGAFACTIALADLIDPGDALTVAVAAAQGAAPLHRSGPFPLEELARADLDIEVPDDALRKAFADPSLTVVTEHGRARRVEIGDTLSVIGSGLRPSSPLSVAVSVDGEPVATVRLRSDQFGRLDRTVVLPQVGLVTADARTLTRAEARDRWAGRTLLVAVSSDDDQLGAVELPIVKTANAATGFVSDKAGRLRNGLELGADDLFISLSGAGLSGAGLSGAGRGGAGRGGRVRAYLVARQDDWLPGDPITAERDAVGKPFVSEAIWESADTPLLLAKADRLVPGAFDIIVRPVRYGFERDEELILQDRDLIVGRHITALVVRERFGRNNPILNGAVTTVQIAGAPIGERPYFRYRDTFAVGENVWAAMDPGIVPAGQIGRKVAFSVIASKTAAQWAASTALTHIPPGAPQELIVQAGCINVNKALVWAAPTQIGSYDVVADFGNNDPDPTAFVADGSFDSPPDLIDGYFTPGFRIVNDPGTLHEFGQVGAFSVDAGLLASMGEPSTLTVQDENTAYFTPGAFTPVNQTFARQALVRFPADVPGATTPAQISSARPDYPVVIVVHGNGHLYTSYGFLLDQLAANGFIAASIFMPNGLNGLARANAFFNHLTLLRTMFGSKAQNNVGVLGHSRGGEAVFKIARLNQSLGLGIGVNALLALAPTDQYGRETLTGVAATRLHVLYGAKDGDVSGWSPPYAGYNVRQSGFSVYDRADGAAKSMRFVENATHNGFVTSNEASPAPLLADADQRKILLADATAFFRMTLRAEPEWSGLFTGEWTAPSVAATGAKTYPQYRATGRRVIDDFEGAHTATSWQTSSIGAGVSQSGLPANPVETQLFPQDSRSPHDTGGLRLSWDTSSDTLGAAIPAGSGDVSGFAALSFSVARVAGSAANPAAAPQNLRVTLRDGAGNERSIRASAFGTIPVAAAANVADNVKSALTTIRIPLASYTIVCAGAVQVDLTDLVSVTLAFTEQSTGEIAVDNLEFTA